MIELDISVATMTDTGAPGSPTSPTPVTSKISISCQVPDCPYVARGDTEGIAIAMLTSHNNVHMNTASTHRRTNKAPQIARPEVKQDITAEEWNSFLDEWRRFKRITDLPSNELADQLIQCCERSLSRLLLKENPSIVEEGEQALTEAIERMAVLQVAVSVRRTKLLATKQESGQLFREFYANVRATASTCNYTIKCSHSCCNTRNPIDYTPRVVKDILVAGIVDDEIRRDVLAHSKLDELSDKDIVKFVEEKEIARNACLATSRSEINGVSQYRKQSKEEHKPKKVKLTLKGNCAKCGTEIALYTVYRSGKINKDPFTHCLKCFRIERDKPEKKTNESENNVVSSFVESLSSFHRNRSDTDPHPL